LKKIILSNKETILTSHYIASIVRKLKKSLKRYQNDSGLKKSVRWGIIFSPKFEDFIWVFEGVEMREFWEEKEIKDRNCLSFIWESHFVESNNIEYLWLIYF
jgi:hypothetical protein